MPALKDFAGRWWIDRWIEDRRAGQVGRFTGQAHLTPDDLGLVYVETGQLTLGDAPPMAAERRYLWRPDDRGGVVVLFADGRDFHRFDPATPQPAAHHLCTPDDYRVAYDFADWPAWSAVWEVSGPRKDYRMESRYRR